MKVKCIRKNEDTQNFGNCTGNIDDLEIGKIYTVLKCKVKKWHTKLYLIGLKGSFNSTMFEGVKNEN